MKKNKAVVFAYHTVGVQCLQTLLANGFEIPLVISHEDAPGENIWFASVRDLCLEQNIRCITPRDLSDPSLLQTISTIAPDYIFSFYYRFMIPRTLLQLAQVSALNMHGSLLPKYRGRVPINWAILHGETKTGATLHVMADKPDAGDIVHQKSVPILPDDTAYLVFQKVVVAAQATLEEVIEQLLEGTFSRRPNRLQEGSYFGGRTPEDGRIDWQKNAQDVYNLVRAVAPPYPGAFTEIAHKKLIIAKAMLASIPARQTHPLLGLQVIDQRIYGFCGDARALLITELVMDNQVLTPLELAQYVADALKA